MSLILYKTNFKQLDGEGPEVINLTGATTTIGRGSQTLHVDATVYARKNGADIISRRHAAVSRSATNQFVLSDLGAINGTFVNLVKISSQVLKDGDIIQLGGITSQSREPDCFCVKYTFRDKGNLNSYVKDLVTTGADGSNPKSVHKKFKSKRDVDNILPIVSATDGNAKKKVRIKVLSGGDENRNNQASDISVCLNADATDSHWGDVKGGGKEPDQKLVAEVAQLRSQMEELKRSHAEALSQATAAAAATASAAVKIPSSDSRSKGTAFLSSSLSTDCSRRTSSINNSSCRERQKRSVIETVEESVRTANNHSSGKERVRSALMESTAIKESPPCSIPERSSCSIDISSLRCNLICAICSLPLLDAVVVSCSHGFCRSCLEKSLRKNKCVCPVCDDLPRKAGDVSCPYVRSEHLDGVVWLLLEASSEQEREAFTAREKVARMELLAMGLDPDINQGVRERNQDEEGDVQVEEEEEREGEGEDDASQLNDTLSQERNSYDRRGDEGASSQEAEEDEEEDYR